MALFPLWGAFFGFSARFSGCFLARGRGVAWATFLGRVLGGTMARGGASGPFSGRFFPFFWSRKRAPAPWATFLAREKWVFGPRVQGGLGAGRGYSHAQYVPGGLPNFFLPRSLLFFACPRSARSCSLHTTLLHTRSTLACGSLIRARSLACGSLASKPTKQRISLSGSHQKHAQPLTTPRLLPKSSAMQSHGDICSIRIPAKQRRGPSAATPSQPVPTFHLRLHTVSQTTNVTSQLLSSVDSGILEAFSHYPTRGSLSA